MSVLAYRIGGWLVALLAIISLGFLCGWKARGPQVREAVARLTASEASCAAERAEAARKAAEMERKAQEAVAAAEAKASAAVARVEYRTREVVKYVEKVTPVLTDLVPNGVVCSHDAAATGDGAALTGPACESPSQASAFRDSDLARTVVINYGRYHDCEERLQAWQEWYADLQKTWNGHALDADGKKP